VYLLDLTCIYQQIAAKSCGEWHLLCPSSRWSSR
jgi:hypothetical protein